MRHTIIAFAVALTACGLFDGPSPDTPKRMPEIDVNDACRAACENLRSPRVSCPEGQGSLGGEPCELVCIRASQLRELPLACWTSARSAVEAKSCGSLRCIR